MKKEDIKLINRSLEGDEKSFEKLLNKYKGPVFSICLRMVKNRDDAEDLSQDLFIRVFNMLDRYNPAFPFSSWIYRITSNLCIDFLRKKKRNRVLSTDQPIKGKDGTMQRQFVSKEIGPERKTEVSEKMKALEESIGMLPEPYRIIIILRHQQQLSYEEISDMLAVPLGTVKARIHRGRKMIVDFLSDRGIIS
ncbi:MAG TPA: sigma-70 family RNA polymerase sigma factor [Candidatus Krumholzibacteriaceae bacterium]|nr:sigma-70 family RNA polymerase sigma factor [Candidatus Krumholzibacteriaceae bacterium]